jgi:hypothetical protein
VDRGLGHASYSLEEQMEEIRKVLTEIDVPEEMEETTDDERDHHGHGPAQADPEQARTR